MSKKMQVLVFCSLLLNVFLVGIIIGHVWGRISGDHTVGREVRELAATLPQDKATLLLETMKRVQRKNRDVQRQIRETRRKAMEILAAPVFDEAAYRLELQRLHELHGLVKQRLGDATIELARQFDQEERKVLVQHLKRTSRRHKERKPSHKEPRPVT